MSFGFSVGDFIAVGKLIFQIGSALRDSKGASAEYQSLLLRLDSLVRTLRIAELSIRGSQLPPPTTNAIREHLEQCVEHLRKFSGVIEKHKKALSKGGSGNKVKDSWRKIGWSLFKREEIKEIDDALRGDIDAISMVLSLCGAQTITDVARKVHESDITLRAIRKAIASPGCLRCTWNSDYKPIRFITALDQPLELPYELGYQWETFRIIVSKLFEGCPGSDWINQGYYEIVDENNQGTTLGSKNWEDLIRPNMVVSMNMLLRKGGGRGLERADCPSCGELYRGYSKCKELKRVRCRLCATWFQISSEARITEVVDGEGGNAKPGAIGPLEQRDSTRRYSSMDEGGRKLFRRWHIIWEDRRAAPRLVEELDKFPISSLQYQSLKSHAANAILVLLLNRT